MTFAPTVKTVVVGIGNRIRTDDGFGLHALQRLQRDPRLPADVTLIDGGTFGLELLNFIFDATHLLLLDAIDVGEPAGTRLRMVNEDLRGLPGAASVHQVGLADLLATLPLVSTAPKQIVLLGVVPQSTDWGTELTAPVQAALDGTIEEAIEQLVRWSQSPVAVPASASARSAG